MSHHRQSTEGTMNKYWKVLEISCIEECHMELDLGDYIGDGNLERRTEGLISVQAQIGIPPLLHFF